MPEMDGYLTSDSYKKIDQLTGTNDIKNQVQTLSFVPTKADKRGNSHSRLWFQLRATSLHPCNRIARLFNAGRGKNE